MSWCANFEFRGAAGGGLESLNLAGTRQIGRATLLAVLLADSKRPALTALNLSYTYQPDSWERGARAEGSLPIAPVDDTGQSLFCLLLNIHSALMWEEAGCLCSHLRTPTLCFDRTAGRPCSRRGAKPSEAGAWRARRWDHRQRAGCGGKHTDRALLGLPPAAHMPRFRLEGADWIVSCV